MAEKAKRKYWFQPINYLNNHTVTNVKDISPFNYVYEIGGNLTKQITKEEMYKLVKQGTDTFMIDTHVLNDGTISGDRASIEFVDWLSENSI